MKTLNLYLIILNILIFPTITLADSATDSKINQANTINLVKSESNDPKTPVKDTSTEDLKKPEPQQQTSTEDAEIDKTEADTSAEKSEPETTNRDRSPEDESEAKDKVKKPTPEEIARLKKLAAADKLYLAGNKAAAVKLYRQAKEVWLIEKERATANKEQVATFDDPQQLSPAGQVFWRNYQQGEKQGLETKVIASLKLLTTREPQFIPGHIRYAEVLKEHEREEESLQVLNQAVSLYPNEPKLLKAKMNADIAEDKWLDASIMARQFALFNPNLPEAEEFNQLAEQYLAKYQSNLRSSITWNAIGNAIAGTVGFALTGNLFGPLSALQTSSLLLKGESAVGESSVKQIKKQLPLLEDKQTTQYVNEIGQKVAAASGRDEFKYEFYLVMDNQLNAFALPGGKVFVNAGAIMNTDSEAELAGLLAHEISHAALSHGFQLAAKGNLTANIISYVPYVGSTASNLIVLNYSRGMEKQADLFGTRILVNAGYAADGVRNLMAKLEKANRDEENSEPPAWLSTHPNSKQRIEYMEKLIVDNNLNRYAYEGVARHQKIKKIVTAEWQEYEKCAKDIKTIEEAKKCAGNVEPEKSKDKPQTNNETDEKKVENSN